MNTEDKKQIIFDIRIQYLNSTLTFFKKQISIIRRKGYTNNTNVHIIVFGLYPISLLFKLGRKTME